MEMKSGEWKDSINKKRVEMKRVWDWKESGKEKRIEIKRWREWKESGSEQESDYKKRGWMTKKKERSGEGKIRKRKQRISMVTLLCFGVGPAEIW